MSFAPIDRTVRLCGLLVAAPDRVPLCAFRRAAHAAALRCLICRLTNNYDATSKRLLNVGRKASGVAVEQTLASFTYDSVGRVRNATDADNVTLRYDYNNLGAITRVTYPDSTYASVEYVCCGMPGMVRDRAGRRSYYDYDPLKRLTRVQDAAGQSLEYRYDGAGNLLELLDAKGKSTKWQYDNLDRVTKKMYADGASQQYSYSLGLLTQMQNPRGGLIGFAYDDVENLTGIDYPSSADVSFAYDNLDRVTQMVDGVGTSNWSYNSLGVVLKEDGPWNNDDVDYGYDNLWRRNSLKVNNSDQATSVYDALGRLSALSSPAGSWAYAYKGNTGMLSQITNPNNTKSVYSYDALERLTNVSNQTSVNANLSSFAYGFDDLANPQRDVRTYVDKTIGVNPTQRASFAYDGVDQLTGEVTSQGATTLNTKSFAYDAMGNRTSSSSASATDTISSGYTPNRLNQYVGLSSSWGGGASTSASTLLYDKSGNLTNWTSVATGAGSASNTVYVYDDADRLTSVVTRNPSTLANVGKSEFQYDGLSRLRVTKEYTWNGTAWVIVAGSEKRRVYDGMDVVQERDGSNGVGSTYTRDGNIGGILAKRSGTTSSYFHYDGSGNVVGLTDSTQASVAEYSYDAFGNTLSATGTQASSNTYRYSTKEYFGSVGLYNYGYRFYSPSLGRWINRDPIQEAGGLNLYGAFANDPVNKYDEYGLAVPILAAVAVVWAVVEIGGALYDAYTTIETWRDPCADGWEKVSTSGLFIVGLAAPGAGYGTAGKAGIKAARGGESAVTSAGRRAHDELAEAKSVFRNQTKGQQVQQAPLAKGGVRRSTPNGTPQIRINPNGSARVDLPRGPTGRETIHFEK